FFPGETTKTIVVPVFGDILWEMDETFGVSLSSPINAILGRSLGTNIIINDDSYPGLTISDTSVVEGNSGTVNALFTISVFPPSSQTITVDYDTADNTATAPSDYVAIHSAVLSISPGETNAIIAVAVKGDTINE